MRTTGPVLAFLCGGLALSVASAPTARAHEPQERVPIDWRQATARRAAHRGDESTPPAPDLPAEARIPPRNNGPPGGGGVPESRGASAAQDIAREALRWGARESWRAGFAHGFEAALEDPRASAWDHEQGTRAGRLDPRIRGLGDHFAGEAAAVPAEAEAESRVKAQFTDLTHEPGPDRAGGMPPREAIPRFTGPYAAEPALDDVFAVAPLRNGAFSAAGRREIDAWRDALPILAKSDRDVRAYDPKWKDAGYAFSVWRDQQGGRSYWAGCSPAERDRLRAAFLARFPGALADGDTRSITDAWRSGFEDGWRYGARVAAEWAYRRGYAEGFDAGIAEAASIAFPYAYTRAYDAAYEHWFNEWSRTPHAGLTDLRVTEESDDGIFEPGERVHVEVSVLNYGGGDGTLDLTASGRGLGAPATVPVHLSGRGRVPGTQRLSLTIAEDAPPRTTGTLTVALGDARLDAPIVISRPLQLEGSPSIEVDRLEGRVTLSAAVANISRRDAHGSIRVAPSARAEGDGQADLGVITAGSRATASIAFTGVHPLDLIGAATTWHLSVVRDGTTDDTHDVRLAPVATDLSNPDLLDFMIAMARTPAVSRSDVEDVRGLMADRLRADWARAVDASGNPYKRDFDGDGAETVLGQLVHVVRDNKRSFTSPQVFDGMDGAVSDLADDLPGPHPLLRKWMKKLAGRL